MGDLLEQYVSAFRQVRRGNRPGAPRTLNREPHKPLLLLSILDLIEAGYFPENRYFLSPELRDLFDSYWATALPDVPCGNIRTPMEWLKSDGFWSRTGETEPFFRSTVFKFDDELFALLIDPMSRAVLRETLISSHFSPDAAAGLRARVEVSEAAELYAKRLIRDAEVRERPAEPVRSQAFRRIVIPAYDYRCAICGVRLFTGDGATVVEAAHIIPWSKSFDDSPRNGMSLCRLCHWSFDAGMLAVSDQYTVLTSRRLTADRNLPGILSAVSQRTIVLPTETTFHPLPKNLGWHRENIFAG